MNVFKKQILKDSKDVIKSLSNKDVEEINEIKRETEKIKEVEEAKKQFIETNTNIKIHQIEQDKRQMKSTSDYLNYQIENMKIKCNQAQQSRMLSYFNIKNKLLDSEMMGYEKTGTRREKASLTCTLISAFTTCAYLVIRTELTVKGVFGLIIGLIAVIYGAVQMVYSLKELNEYITKFLDTSSSNRLENEIQLGNTFLSAITSIGYTCYSISANYKFWCYLDFDGFGAVIVSCLFDFLAISYTLNCQFFKFLKFSKKYENEIVSREEDKPREEEQNSKNTHILSVQNIQIEEEKNGQNEELKTGKTVGQEVQEKQVKIVQEISDVKTGQTIEFKPKTELAKTDKKQVKTEDKKQSKKPSVKRTSASKITFKNMQESINNLPEGTIIKPKLLNMTGNSNYKTWIKKCENVERAENGNYIKKTSSNLIALER